MNRRLMFIIIFTMILLSSCANKSESIALIAPSNVEVCIAKGDISLILFLDNALISKLCSISGLDAESMVVELEPDAEVYLISDSEYDHRNGYLSLLLGEANSNDIADVLSSNKKLLQKSKLVARMDECTGGYDSRLLDLVDGVEKPCQYELSSILYNATDWSVAKAFYREWKDSIFR